jgi:hypothetical protein
MQLVVNHVGRLRTLRRWSAIVVLATACAGGRIVRAQTLFAWPDTLVDYAHYGTPEECLAAVNRLRLGVAWGADRDTFPADPDAPLPAAITATAKRCAANFNTPGTADTVEPRDLPVLMSLDLMAGDDDAGHAVAARMTASVAKQPVPVRAAMLAAVLHRYVEAAPPRIADVQRVIAELQRLGPQASAARRDAFTALGTYAQETMNTTLLKVANDGWLDEVAYLPDSLKNDPGFRAAIVLGAANNAALLALPQLASGDTSAYWNRVSMAVKRIVGDAPGVDAFLAQFRRRAPAIEGDFWFHRDSVAAPRPTRGTVGLVVFVDAECGSSCAGGYAALRRTAQRFGPALQITLVATTHGYFRLRPPLAPAEEAEAMRQYFFDYLHLPGALAISTTRFARRPDPDRRLVAGVFGTLQRYDGEGRHVTPMLAFVVNRDGSIAWSTVMSPQQERLINATLSALIASGTHTSS